MLSTGAIAYIAMMHWSSTLKHSRARVVMVMWGFLVGIALTRSAVFDTPFSPAEQACHGRHGRLLQYPIQLESGLFECTYKCFSVEKPMRMRSELIAVPIGILQNSYSRLAYVLIGPVQFAAYAAISWDSHEHTPSQLCTRIVMKYLNPKHHEDITKLIYNTSQERWYGGYFVLFSFVRRPVWGPRKALLCFLAIPWFVLALVIDVLSIPLLITNVVLNELNFLGSNLPVNEANRAIGQWGPIVGSALVVYAAIVNRGLEWREEREKVKKQRREEQDVDGKMTTLRPDEIELELGRVNEQTCGVVKPGIVHVQTLRDMDEIVTRPNG